MRRVHRYHLLFGLTLLTLLILSLRLIIYFGTSVELERSARLGELKHATAVAALMLGHGEQPPVVGPLQDVDELEVIETTQWREGDIFAPAIPRHPHLGVRADRAAVSAIEDKLVRRRWMVAGEGGLLLILVGVCSYMLHSLVRQERRHVMRMEAFVAAVTHEMKTPLAGIKSMLQTFIAGRVPKGQEERLFALGLKEAERLEHTVENVLISGRLRTEHYQLECETIDLRPFMEGFLEHRRRYLVEHPEVIRLLFDENDEQLMVRGDSSALKVVLENLTDNAIKYGGADPRVTLRVGRSPDRVFIAVADQGIGFSPEQGERLFARFRRSLDDRASVQHGAGIGLSIARALAHRMGGELNGASDGPNKGSTFTITLREAC